MLRAVTIVAMAGALCLSGCTSDGAHHTSSGSGAGAGKERVYYVAADEVEWDYAPLGKNGITGAAFGEDEQVFVANRPGRIGSKYTKCIYRGYTSGRFDTLLERPDADKYLGSLGPVIRVEVGDEVKVVFKNNCTIDASIHVHGLRYDKKNEGAEYSDGSDATGDKVAKGQTYSYEFEVPERSGPAAHDGSSVMWMYHSHVDEVADTYAGLMGPIVVTAKGKAREDGSPKDVDREVFANFWVQDENSSPYLEDNVKTFAKKPYAAAGDEGFTESNLMHAINGYVYGNGPLLSLTKGEKVRWYVSAMGTEVDLHTPHWHGNVNLIGGMRMDVTSLLPMDMKVADMQPDAAGIWLFHCHVNDHITAGMQMRYEVK